MQGTIAVTDYGWYDFLQARAPAEVNFWTPSARRALHAPEFSPFFFKLKAPHNAIAGFGFFATWSSLPDWLAWETFGEGNGVGSLEELRTRLGGIRQRIGYRPAAELQNIGCILLVQPVFFPAGAWIRQPSDWPARTVSSKSYSLTAGEGARVWRECQERVASFIRSELTTRSPIVTGPLGPRYGAPATVLPRLGQGTFRIAVTDAYGRQCAATGEHSLPVLEAAHIRSYSREGPHDVQNGVLLRADLHRLFDKGYLTITPKHRVEVSPRLRQDFQNGRTYYPLHGALLHLPKDPRKRPGDEYLRWHNGEVFLG